LQLSAGAVDEARRACRPYHRAINQAIVVVNSSRKPSPKLAPRARARSFSAIIKINSRPIASQPTLAQMARAKSIKTALATIPISGDNAASTELSVTN